MLTLESSPWVVYEWSLIKSRIEILRDEMEGVEVLNIEQIPWEDIREELNMIFWSEDRIIDMVGPQIDYVNPLKQRSVLKWCWEDIIILDKIKKLKHFCVIKLHEMWMLNESNKVKMWKNKLPQASYRCFSISRKIKILYNSILYLFFFYFYKSIIYLSHYLELPQASYKSCSVRKTIKVHS